METPKLSIIIWHFSSLKNMTLTFNSLKEQLCSELELIIVNDFDENPITNTNVLDFYKKIFELKNVRVIFNSKTQGISVSWNIGKNNANGEYLWFVKDGVVFAPGIISKFLTNQYVLKKQPDMIQYNLGFLNDDSKFETSFLTNNKVFILEAHKEILAYVDTYVYITIFKKNIIDKYNLNFRSYNNYYILFIYQFLANAKTFLRLDDKALEIAKKDIWFSAFQLLRQWPHIFNYYRSILKYHFYKDEIIYAFMRFSTFTYIKIIKELDNKILTKKSIDWINKRIEKKIPQFISNKYIEYKKDDDFSIHAKNLNNYLKQINKVYNKKTI